MWQMGRDGGNVDLNQVNRGGGRRGLIHNMGRVEIGCGALSNAEGAGQVHVAVGDEIRGHIAWTIPNRF